MHEENQGLVTGQVPVDKNESELVHDAGHYNEDDGEGHPEAVIGIAIGDAHYADRHQLPKIQEGDEDDADGRTDSRDSLGCYLVHSWSIGDFHLLRRELVGAFANAIFIQLIHLWAQCSASPEIPTASGSLCFPSPHCPPSVAKTSPKKTLAF